jgi:transglutaminase-like putative cysteine protease
MKIVLKKLNKFLLFLVGWGFLISPKLIQAQENPFETTLDSVYEVQENGVTTVNHNFKIKNLTPTTFVKQYGLKLSSTRLDEITVTTNGQEIVPEIATTQTLTTIGISFPNEIVGQGKVRDFTVSYKNPDLAQISGQVLEVGIPSTATQSDSFDQHTIIINTPINFGLPNRVSLENYQTQLVSKDGKNLIQTKIDQAPEKGISLLFGEQQIFDLNLQYHLENPYSNPRLIQVALPPDTAYQKTSYQNLNPQPENMELDDDGNWIATYKLESNSAVTVTAQVLVKVTLDADTNFPQTNPQKEYLQAQKFWPVNDPQIQGLAGSLGGVESIYQKTIETLDYNFETVDQEKDRMGASQALNNPDQAHCEEFTDLFVSLARAQDIPSRRLTGYAHTNNEILRPLGLAEDILHAWPEYWSETEQRWIQVDPTWEKTSGGVDYFHQFDLNHITFAINGLSSTLPYPAGSYHFEDNQDKTVEVGFGDYFESLIPEFEIGINQKKLAVLPLPESTYLSIYNPTGQAFYNLTLNLQSNDSSVEFNSPNPLVIKSILPFETKKIKINLSAAQVIPQPIILSISHNQQTVDLYVTPESNIYQQLTNTYFLLGVGITAIILALGTGSVLVFRSKQKNSLRRQSKKSKK